MRELAILPAGRVSCLGQCNRGCRERVPRRSFQGDEQVSSKRHKKGSVLKTPIQQDWKEV